MDLQSMSEKPHESCPECGKACERVLSASIVSVRGSEYRAAERAEKRSESVARANLEHTKLRAETERRVFGHTHNCVAAGCFGAAAREKYLAEKNADNSLVSSTESDAEFGSDSNLSADRAAGTGDRIQGMPYLVGADRAKDSKANS